VVKRRILIRTGMVLAVLALIVVLPAHLVVGQAGGSQSATVTVTAVPGYIYTPPGGGGGGGGGIGGGGTPPPALTVVTPDGPMTMEIASDGTLLQSYIIADPSGNVLLGLDSGTRILCSGNQVPERLEMRLSGEPLPVPEGMAAVSPIYDLTAYISGGVPQPVVFDPPLRLQINYDPEGLPENTTSVFIAYYDAKQGWIPLEAPSGFVDAAGTAEAQINHFAPFAVIAELAPPVLPAHFELHNLDIKPNPVRVGESITISAQLVNTGGLSGEYTLTLNVEGLPETSQTIQLTPGQSQEVSFSLTPDKPGSYQIEIGDLWGNLVVEAIPTPLPTPTPLTPVPAPFPWWIIAPIMAGAAVVGSLYFFLYRRRQYAAVVGPAGVEAPVAPPSPIKAISYPAIVADWRRVIVSVLAKVWSAIVRWTAIVADQRGVIVSTLTKAGTAIVRWSAIVADQRGVIISALAKAGTAIVRWSAIVADQRGVIVSTLAKAGSVIVRWSAIVADQRGVIVSALAKAGSVIVRWSAVVISKLGLKK